MYEFKAVARLSGRFCRANVPELEVVEDFLQDPRLRRRPVPFRLFPQEEKDVDHLRRMGEGLLPLPGHRIGRIAQGDERLAGEHHEQVGQTPLRDGARRRPRRGVPWWNVLASWRFVVAPSPIGDLEAFLGLLRHRASLAHAKTRAV